MSTSSQDNPQSPAAGASAREVFDRFSHRLIALARTRLDRQTRQKLDPEDVVQSVFRSFFSRRDAGRVEVTGWDNLWSLLVVFTVRKCARKATALRAARRDVRREMPLAGDDALRDAPLIDREPTPDEVASLVETVESLLAGSNETEREIILLRLQGHGPREITRLLSNVSERKVHRVLAQVRRRLEPESDERRL